MDQLYDRVEKVSGRAWPQNWTFRSSQRASVVLVSHILLFSLLPQQSFTQEQEPQSTSHSHVILAIEPVAFGPGMSFSPGIMAGYYVRDNWLLFLEKTWSTYNQSYGDVSAGYRRARQSESLGIHTKYFMSKSLYGRVGVDQRKSSFKDTGSLAPEFYESSYLTLNLAIGNELKLKYFVLGCDWFGYVVPTNMTPQIRSFIDPQIQLLRTYLGIFF